MVATPATVCRPIQHLGTPAIGARNPVLDAATVPTASPPARFAATQVARALREDSSA
ncbi:hypothetical protein D9X30_0639 [Cupriavidus sp. U2]|nr:hypothetical protein D9X30_0639 [Cupriavidus sp. U2]